MAVIGSSALTFTHTVQGNQRGIDVTVSSSWASGDVLVMTHLSVISDASFIVGPGTAALNLGSTDSVYVVVSSSAANAVTLFSSGANGPCQMIVTVMGH